MKKITLLFSALFCTLVTFAGALGTGYSKVLDISTLAAGDQVVLYCDDAELGVTGWNGNKDATVASAGWVQYQVEVATGGVMLKDAAAGKYIALIAKNSFKYDAQGSVFVVSSKGALQGEFSGAKYYLYENSSTPGSIYYRMYADKSNDNNASAYLPFYVYKVGEGGSTPDDGGNGGNTTPDDDDNGNDTPVEGMLTCAEAASIASAENYKGTENVTVLGYVVELGKNKTDDKTGRLKQCFYMSDTKGGTKQFYAYWAYVPAFFEVGDQVTVTGILQNYQGTIEIADGEAKLYGSSDDNGGNTTPGTVPTNITGLQYADAYYYTYEGVGCWAFDLYADYDYDTYVLTYPELYIDVDQAKSSTAINGTYELYYAGVWVSANDSVDTYEYPESSLTIKNVDNEGNYRFKGWFVGTDMTYTFDQVVNVYAMDFDTFEEIILEEKEETAVENTPSNNIPEAKKVVRRGNIYILQGDKTYNILGAELK